MSYSPQGHTESDMTLTHTQVERRLESRPLGKGRGVEPSWCGHSGGKERNPDAPKGLGMSDRKDGAPRGWSSGIKMENEAGVGEKIRRLVLKVGFSITCPCRELDTENLKQFKRRNRD